MRRDRVSQSLTTSAGAGVGRHPEPPRVPHLTRKTPWPYVNHYHFHVIDKEWGHLTFKLSGHPPFGVQVMLNGHEWVERRAGQRTISVVKEGNCFVGGSDLPALHRLPMPWATTAR
jgi:hypothetical protein